MIEMDLMVLAALFAYTISTIHWFRFYLQCVVIVVVAFFVVVFVIFVVLNVFGVIAFVEQVSFLVVTFHINAVVVASVVVFNSKILTF